MYGFVQMVIAVVLHRVEIAHHSLIGLVDCRIVGIIGNYSGRLFLPIFPLHVEGHQNVVGRIFERVFFELVESIALLKGSFDEVNFALGDLNETHFKTNLSNQGD